MCGELLHDIEVRHRDICIYPYFIRRVEVMFLARPYLLPPPSLIA
jgi:hypothetical protein